MKIVLLAFALMLTGVVARAQDAAPSSPASAPAAVPTPTTAPHAVLPSSTPVHPENLNDAFKLRAAEVEKAIQKGQDLAKRGKTFGDIYNDNRQMPVGVKGEKGRSHESGVVCYSLNGVLFEIQAFKAATNYDPVPEHPFGDIFARHVSFLVNLRSVPKVGLTVFGRNRFAGKDDVQVTKFVLTDDKGNVINTEQSNSLNGIQTGSVGFSGVNALPHVNTSQTTSSANVHAFDSNGDSANAYGTGTSTTTQFQTEYIPWSVSRPYYSATYQVIFPLFDAQGQALITRNAKTITLHIITPNGEKQVSYDLHPPKI